MNLSKDRILQARFFLKQAKQNGSDDRDIFRYFTEATIVAARSVTILLQKQFHNHPGFSDWYAGIQQQLSADQLSRFLLEKRNFILKEGAASLHKTFRVVIPAPKIREFPKLPKSFTIGNRGLPPFDLVALMQEWAAVTSGARKLEPGKRPPPHTTEEYFFAEPQWSMHPVFNLLSKQLDKLESIVDDAIDRFDEPK